MVIAVIFGMVLELYLQIRVDNAYNLRAEKQYLTAQVIATVARQQKAKFVETDKGIAMVEGDKIKVTLIDGSTYSF